MNQLFEVSLRLIIAMVGIIGVAMNLRRFPCLWIALMGLTFIFGHWSFRMYSEATGYWYDPIPWFCIQFSRLFGYFLVAVGVLLLANHECEEESTGDD